MQQLARDEAGNVWELDANGEPVRMVPAPGQQGRVFSLPPNPKDVKQEARQATNDALSASDRAADNERADRSLALQERSAEAMTELRRIQAEAAAEKANGGRARLTTLNALAKQIDRVQQLYESNVQGFNWNMPALSAAVPTEGNRQFDTSGAQLSSLGLAAFRVPGTGTVSDRDAIMFDRANLPSADKYDSSIEEQLRGMRSRVEEEFRTLGQSPPRWYGAQQKADNEVPDPTTGAALKPPPADDDSEFPPANGGDPVATDGKTRIVRDPRVAAQVDAMINAGASEGMINTVLKRQGFPNVSSGDLARAQRWMNENPGKRYYGSDPTRSEDLNFGQQILANPAVAPVAAGLAHYTNNATAGLVGNLAGEEGQGALDAAAALNPTASTIGGLAGGVTGALGAEAGIAARAPNALARFAPRIADAVYGGALGFNTAREGEGAQGALYGAGAGLAGGWLGQRAMSGTGRALRGVQDANVGYLRGQGVPLTVGQTLGGSGRLGATVKNVEDALTSVPGVSSIVNARRTEGLQGFNEAAMRQAGAPANIPVTASGAQGMEQLRAGIGPAYDNALGGAAIDTNDPAFASALQEVVEAANGIPNVNGAREAAAAALDSRIGGATHPATGIMPGRGFQEAYRGLGRTGRERANSDYGYEVGQVMRQGQNTLAEALDAQNPGALDAFRNANAVNRNANVIAQALDKAKNQNEELFTPAQINMADAMSAKRLEGPMASASGDRPFFDLARAGQEVLPSKLPDSGTATRGLVGAGLVGGIGGAGVGSAFGDPSSGAQTGLGLTLLLAAGGSRPAQRAMVSLLADRPDLLTRLGNTVFGNARLGGGAGAGAASSFALGQ